MKRHNYHWSIYVSAFACLLAAALLVAQAWELKRNADRSIGVAVEETEDGVVVDDLEQGGPAARAGLRAGDLLVEFGATRLTTLDDYDAATRELSRGDLVRLRVERAEVQHLVMQVAAGTALDGWRWLRRFAVVLISTLVGVFSLMGRGASTRARLLSTLFFLIAFEYALPEALRADSSWLWFEGFAFYLLTGAQVAIELHLATVIPRPRPNEHHLNGLIPLYYLVGLAIAVGGSATFLDSIVGQESLPWSVYGFDEMIHQVVFPLWAVWNVALLAYGIMTTTDRLGRLQATLVFLGVLPWTGYIVLGWVSNYPDRLTTHGWWYVVGPLLVLSYPVSVFVAIFRYQLFDLDVVVRRSLIYASLTTSVILIFYAAVGAGGALISRVVEGGAGIWSFVGATVLLGLLFSPLTRAIQSGIDRRFFPERPAMRERLIGLAGELPVLGKPERMSDHLVVSLRRIFRARTAMLVLEKPGSRVLVEAAKSGGTAGARAAPFQLSMDEPCLAEIGSSDAPLRAGKLRASHPDLDDEPCLSGAGLVIPLRLEERLVGLLLLGEKTTGLRYNAEEIELLHLLAHNVTTVLENGRLFESATFEGLTGLLRREAILELLESEVGRAERYGRPLTVALADIDFFKGINDRFGHLVGDRALRRVAQELSASIRRSDSAGRFGGEEFLLVFPETDPAHGSGLAEKLRGAVEALEMTADDASAIPLRISVGVSTLVPPGTSGPTNAHDLIAAADSALYRAKNSGRNRVEQAVVEDAERAPERTA